MLFRDPVESPAMYKGVDRSVSRKYYWRKNGVGIKFDNNSRGKYVDLIHTSQSFSRL